jgi:hypothetical protein
MKRLPMWSQTRKRALVLVAFLILFAHVIVGARLAHGAAVGYAEPAKKETAQNLSSQAVIASGSGCTPSVDTMYNQTFFLAMNGSPNAFSQIKSNLHEGLGNVRTTVAVATWYLDETDGPDADYVYNAQTMINKLG